jgi:hypothetical protein
VGLEGPNVTRDQKKTEPLHASDEISRRGKTIQVALDPVASLSSHPALIQDERWIESQLEEPERWDGLS